MAELLCTASVNTDTKWEVRLCCWWAEFGRSAACLLRHDFLPNMEQDTLTPFPGTRVAAVTWKVFRVLMKCTVVVPLADPALCKWLKEESQHGLIIPRLTSDPFTFLNFPSVPPGISILCCRCCFAIRFCLIEKNHLLHRWPVEGGGDSEGSPHYKTERKKNNNKGDDSWNYVKFTAKQEWQQQDCY